MWKSTDLSRRLLSGVSTCHHQRSIRYPAVVMSSQATSWEQQGFDKSLVALSLSFHSQLRSVLSEESHQCFVFREHKALYYYQYVIITWTMKWDRCTFICGRLFVLKLLLHISYVALLSILGLQYRNIICHESNTKLQYISKTVALPGCFTLIRMH